MNQQKYIDAIIEHSIVQEFALLGLIDRLIKDGIFSGNVNRETLAAHMTAEAQKSWNEASLQNRADLMAIAKQEFANNGITLDPPTQ